MWRGHGSEVASACTRALELAKSLGDLEYQKRSLWGLWSFHVNGFDYRTALSLALAHRFASLVATSLDPNGRSNPPGNRNGEESMARTVTEKHHRPAEPLSTRHVFLDTQVYHGLGHNPANPALVTLKEQIEARRVVLHTSVCSRPVKLDHMPVQAVAGTSVISK